MKFDAQTLDYPIEIHGVCSNNASRIQTDHAVGRNGQACSSRPGANQVYHGRWRVITNDVVIASDKNTIHGFWTGSPNFVLVQYTQQCPWTSCTIPKDTSCTDLNNGKSNTWGFTTVTLKAAPPYTNNVYVLTTQSILMGYIPNVDDPNNDFAQHFIFGYKTADAWLGLFVGEGDNNNGFFYASLISQNKKSTKSNTQNVQFILQFRNQKRKYFIAMDPEHYLNLGGPYGLNLKFHEYISDKDELTIDVPANTLLAWQYSNSNRNSKFEISEVKINTFLSVSNRSHTFMDTIITMKNGVKYYMDPESVWWSEFNNT